MEVQSDWKQVIVISGEVEAIDIKQKLVAPCRVPSKVRSVLHTKLLAMYVAGCIDALMYIAVFHSVF